MIKKFYLITLILFFIIQNSNAQNIEIKGNVTVFDSIRLQGVDVKSINSKQSTISDSLGNFSLSCASNDKLVISAQGFYTQKVKLTDSTKLVIVNLNLKPVSKGKEYEIGYGHISEDDKLFAISNLNKDNVNFSNYKSVYDILSSRFTGVTVLNRDIQIRGLKTFMGSTSALVILDGVEVESSSLESLPTSEIKSIDILKDAGASIYGARGANGVVLIETRGNN